jgi:hypothetical protein
MIYYPAKKPAPEAQVRKGGSGSRKTELGESSEGELQTSTCAKDARQGLVEAEDRSTRVGPGSSGPVGGCEGESSPVGESLVPCGACGTGRGMTDRITCRVCGAVFADVRTGRLARVLRTMADTWAFGLDGSGSAGKRAFILVCAADLLAQREIRSNRWRDRALLVWAQWHGLENAACVRGRANASYRAVLLEARVRLRSWYPEIFGGGP